MVVKVFFISGQKCCLLLPSQPKLNSPSCSRLLSSWIDVNPTVCQKHLKQTHLWLVYPACVFAGITSQTALGQRTHLQTGGTGTNLCQVNTTDPVTWLNEKKFYDCFIYNLLSSGSVVSQAVLELVRSSSSRVWSELCSWKQSMLGVWVLTSKSVFNLLSCTSQQV